jgi:hypothetical protein
MSAILQNTRMLASALAPITKDQNINIENIAAVILRNAGDATVNIWYGAYTLDSKETVSLNITEEFSGLDLFDVPITFDTTTGSVKKLQILVMKKQPVKC